MYIHFNMFLHPKKHNMIHVYIINSIYSTVGGYYSIFHANLQSLYYRE